MGEEVSVSKVAYERDLLPFSEAERHPRRDGKTRRALVSMAGESRGRCRGYRGTQATGKKMPGF